MLRDELYDGKQLKSYVRRSADLVPQNQNALISLFLVLIHTDTRIWNNLPTLFQAMDDLREAGQSVREQARDNSLAALKTWTQARMTTVSAVPFCFAYPESAREDDKTILDYIGVLADGTVREEVDAIITGDYAWLLTLTNRYAEVLRAWERNFNFTYQVSEKRVLGEGGLFHVVSRGGVGYIAMPYETDTETPENTVYLFCDVTPSNLRKVREEVITPAEAVMLTRGMFMATMPTAERGVSMSFEQHSPERREEIFAAETLAQKAALTILYVEHEDLDQDRLPQPGRNLSDSRGLFLDS